MRINFTYKLIALFYLTVSHSIGLSVAQTGDWKTVTNTGIIHRHECSFAEISGKFYLIGGRTGGLDKYTNIYDASTGTWTTGTNKPPVELHHFQAAAYNGEIYILGAFTGGHPNETPVDKVYIYKPSDDSWREGGIIPADRRRGAAGVVVYNNKMYVIAGATQGHMGGNVGWLDEYDPATGEWKILTTAPHARDHYQAVVSGDKLYVAGGRMSKGYIDGSRFVNEDELVYEVDVYDFMTNTWETYPHNLPTGRAGTAAAVLNNELLVIGGESSSQLIAHNETEAMDLSTKTWRELAPLDSGRHASHAVVFNNKIYIASGSKSRGGSGSSELNSMEEFSLTATQPNELSMPSEINFGQVSQNETKSETVTLINHAENNDIIINTISFANNTGNEFSIASPPILPYTLTAGSSLTLEIILDPATLGTKTAELTIGHTGVNNPGSIMLEGESVVDITGIDKGNEFSAVVIYPNPTRDRLIIENVSDKLFWEVYNYSGKKEMEGKSDFSNSHYLDISNLTKGVYILTLKNKTGNIKRSFLLKKE